MFDGGSDNVALLRILFERCMNRGVVTFRGAARENHIAGMCANEFSHICPRRFNNTFEF